MLEQIWQVTRQRDVERANNNSDSPATILLVGIHKEKAVRLNN
jgi:hypothetical protein